MQYKIVKTDKIYVAGIKATTNFNTNAQVTSNLARQFMPRLKEVNDRKDNFTLSLQKYQNFDVKNFNPNLTFEKWIGVEVRAIENVSHDFETLQIEEGEYLVIDFKGSMTEFIKLWQYIHFEWLPNSKFTLDQRPHFERLSANYNPTQVVNEEEIWIPIKPLVY